MEEKKSLILNKDYATWLKAVKEQVRVSQLKAAVQVNRELLRFYWNLGADIVEKQKHAQWGDGFLQQLSADLLSEFPEMKGFSLRNLKAIRQWYLTYKDWSFARFKEADNQEPIMVKQAVSPIGQQVVAQLENTFFSVPWGHHLVIMQKCKDKAQALFYLQQTVEQSMSRAVLMHCIESQLYERQGKAVSNFTKTLPAPQSDLAQQTLKDPYNFDFLAMRDGYVERELEDALVHNVTRFLLELGKGFAFMGRQVQMEVGNETFFPDLLFYHTEMRCYVVIELKVVPFDPAFLGQLNFYVSAVNHKMKKEADAPTIGLLICKTKDDVVAQYALEGYSQPLGISAYELANLLPKELQSQLPTIEEIEMAIEGRD